MAVQEVIAIFTAAVEGSKDVKDLDSAMSTAEKSAVTLDSAMGKLGESVKKFATAAGIGLVVHAVANFTKQTSEAADTVGKLSLKTGIAVADLEALSYAARLNGASTEGMTAATKIFARNLDGMDKASSPAAQALQKLGLSAKDLKEIDLPANMSAAMGMIGQAMAGMADPTQKMALAMDLFGKQGVELIPTLENLSASTAEFRELGGGFTQEGTDAAALYTDSMLRIDSTLTRLKNLILISVAPVFTWLNGVISSAIKVVNKLTEGTRIFDIVTIGLIGTLGYLAATLISSVLPALLPIMFIFAKWAIAVALIVIALDDFWAWWEGRPSAFGAILDQMFGDGTSAKFRNWTKSLVQALGDGFVALGQLLMLGILGVIDMVAFMIQTGYTSIQSFTATVSTGISRTINFVLELILRAQKAWASFSGDPVDTSGLERMIAMQKEAQNASASDLSRAAKSLPLQKFREDLANGMSYGSNQFMQTAMGTKAISTADNRVQTVNVTVQGASDPTATANRVGPAVASALDLKSVAAGVPAG